MNRRFKHIIKESIYKVKTFAIEVPIRDLFKEKCNETLLRSKVQYH